MMNKPKLGRKSSITPVNDTCGRGEDFECMIMEEKSNIPLHQRVSKSKYLDVMTRNILSPNRMISIFI